MFDELISVSPCSEWESASSLGNRAHGGPPRVRSRTTCVHEFAYGTVSWPLNDVARKGNGLYGSAGTICGTRTLVNYCALSLGDILRKQLMKDVIDGTGSNMRTDLRHPLSYAQNLSMRCPKCDEKIWDEFGYRAQLWLHQAPFVEACAIDGSLLQPWEPGAEPPCGNRPARTASPAKIAFAEDVLALSRVAGDPSALAASIRTKLEKLDLLMRDGAINFVLLEKFVHDYVEARYHGAAVESIMVFPHTCRVLQAFLWRPLNSVPPTFWRRFMPLRETRTTSVIREIAYLPIGQGRGSGGLGHVNPIGRPMTTNRTIPPFCCSPDSRTLQWLIAAT